MIMKRTLLTVVLCLACCFFGACKNDDSPRPAPSAAPSTTSTEVLPGGSPFKTRNCRARCQILGMCHFDEKLERCVARSEKDCRDSRACKHSGICTFNPQGICLGTSDKDCAASVDCKERGLCKLGRGGATTCIASSNTDCEQSEICKKEARCTNVNGLCLVDDAADCKGSPLCKKDGLCSVQPNPHKKPPKRCAALTKQDCQASEACKLEKRCTPKDGTCAKS